MASARLEILQTLRPPVVVVDGSIVDGNQTLALTLVFFPLLLSLFLALTRPFCGCPWRSDRNRHIGDVLDAAIFLLLLGLRLLGVYLFPGRGLSPSGGGRGAGAGADVVGHGERALLVWRALVRCGERGCEGHASESACVRVRMPREKVARDTAMIIRCVRDPRTPPRALCNFAA